MKIVQLLKCFLSFSFLAVLLTCTAKNVEQYEIIEMGKKVDPDFHLILPGVNDTPVDCAPYGQGCQFGIRVQHQFLSFVMISYLKPEQAQTAAAELGQYSYQNWLFDQVAGEKILEAFVEEAYQAQKAPNKANPHP